MLIKAEELKGYQLDSIDGTIGSARGFYFDDKYWSIRYLIAKTGGWLSDRKVLLSPYSMSAIDPVDETVSLALTKRQIEDSPSIDTDAPVSQQFEDSYYLGSRFAAPTGLRCVRPLGARLLDNQPSRFTMQASQSRHRLLSRSVIQKAVNC